MASNAITDRPPYRIETRRTRTSSGRNKQVLHLKAGLYTDVTLYSELDGARDVWGSITLWNPALNEHGNSSILLDNIQAIDLLRKILGPLDFSPAAQAARRASLLAEAA